MRNVVRNEIQDDSGVAHTSRLADEHASAADVYLTHMMTGIKIADFDAQLAVPEPIACRRPHFGVHMRTVVVATQPNAAERLHPGEFSIQ